MEKTKHSLLEKGDNSWCHFRPTDGGVARGGGRSHRPGALGELETLLGTGQGGRAHVERTEDGEKKKKNRTKNTHSKIRLKVRIRFICICATVIKRHNSTVCHALLVSLKLTSEVR